MPNTQLRQHIDDMPGILAKLERIPEITTRLDLIDTLRAHALSLEPLDGVETMALSDYDRDWLVRYTYNSNAIEGSTLTLQDTSLVLEGEFVPSDSPARFVFAARGVADGMAYVREYASERRELDPELIQRIHEVTALDLQPFARGTFRPYGYLARITATRVKTADPLDRHGCSGPGCPAAGSGRCSRRCTAGRFRHRPGLTLFAGLDGFRHEQASETASRT